MRIWPLLILLGGCTAAAQRAPTAAPLIPLEDLMRAPAFSSPALSPAGDRLAFIEPEAGRGRIVVRDLRTGAERRLHRDAERSLQNVVWSGDGRWLLYFQDAGGDEGFHLYRLDPDAPAAAPVDLTPFPGAVAELVRLPAEAGGTAVIALNRRDPRYADAYRVDLATGELEEAARNALGFTDWAADARGRVLLGSAIRDDGSVELLARSSEGAAWRVVYASPADERFRLLTMDPDGRSALILSDRGYAAQRLMRLDLATGRVREALDQNCGRYDDEGAVQTRTGRIAFLRCTTEKPELRPITREAATLMTELRSHAGEAALMLDSHTPDLEAAVLYADASDEPGRYLLFREGEVRRLAEARPWLAGTVLARSEAHWISARDGLPLLAYLTRPPGAQGPTPLLVAIHGGPWSRDSGGFEAQTQLAANRGYAVLQVNFRGSTGLGTRHFGAGLRQFGRAMSDDIIDAIGWAVSEGIADPARICAIGGSYGGYATLVALTRDADRFRCGIDYAGPADLITLMEAFPPSWQPFLPRSWHRFVGDPANAQDRADMIARSPIHRLDRLRAPLLIFQGANDPRVTQAQSDAIVCSLRARGIAADYLLAGNEGHSFGNEETGLAVARATEQFLAAHLGGRVQGRVGPRVEQALEALRSAGRSIRCSIDP